MGSTENAIAANRDEVIAEHGPWVGFNIELAPGVYSMGPGLVGVAETRVFQVLQIASALLPAGLDGIRVLDLGAHEGGFALEFARQGAEVVAMEGREYHLAKARFARDALELDNLKVVSGDVRSDLGAELGTFDLVLCLGILYHLSRDDIGPFLTNVRKLTRNAAIIETQLALRPRRSMTWSGASYSGIEVREHPRFAGAAMSDTPSFWLTEPSLLTLLGRVGFGSVLQVRSPLVPELMDVADHGTYVAVVGQARTPRTVSVEPEPLAIEIPERSGRPRAHPSQGLRYRVMDRVRTSLGRGLLQGLLTKGDRASGRGEGSGR